MQSHNTATRFLLGFTWGFLPCGMIYSTVLWASSAANSHNDINNAALSTALLMFIFGLGTMPSLLLLNIGSLKIGQKLGQFFRIQHSKRAIGFVLIVFGLWSLASVFLPMPSFLHNMPANNSAPQSEHQHHHH